MYTESSAPALSGKMQSSRSPQVCESAGRWLFLCNVLLALVVSGCTGVREYVQNGLKVGPNYGQPPAPVAPDWIDAADQRVRTEADDLSHWWAVFQDPVLDALIAEAYQQNISLRAAGFRVLEARAQLRIDAGNLFPQTQQATANYTRLGLSRETANNFLRFAGTSGSAKRFYDRWDYGFNLNWELDFWGRFRRAVEADAAELDASVENYDDVLVTLLSDVATNYVQYRTTEQRIKFAKENVELQRETLVIVRARVNAGTVDELDLLQAQSNLDQLEAQIPELETALRQYNNQLCILLGLPPEDLECRLGAAPIPTAPLDVAVGIPADLLRRRPDVRRAERQAAAQCARIGVAESDFYPHIAVNGAFGYSAQNFGKLFQPSALNGNIGPAIQWNILNYGRIASNVLLQDATFQERVADYQSAVLSAAQQVENGLVTFLRAQQRRQSLDDAVKDADRATRIAITQYKAGTIDFTRVAQLQQNLVQVKDTLAQAQGEVAGGLIQVYRALGGGWQIRCDEILQTDYSSMTPPPTLEPLPAPEPGESVLPDPREATLDDPNSSSNNGLPLND